ncbi:thioredoxin domain-containing protein [Saccharomonospora sp. NPDC006951]
MSRRRPNPVTARSPFSPNVIIILVVAVVAAVVFGGLLFMSRGDAGQAEGGAGSPERGNGASTLIGSGTGGVTVVEFLDYQCPACAGYDRNIIRQIERDYEGRITVEIRNFPLDMHPLATRAASAAQAAAAQGRFREMHHSLYDGFPDWAVTPGGRDISADGERATEVFEGYAREAGLDIDRFRRDMSSDETRERIAEDLSAGREAGVSGTPTIFVEGTRFRPAGQDYATVDAQLRRLIEDKLGQ